MAILDAELAARTPTQWYEESVRIPKISELEARKRVEAGRVDFLCEFIAENDREDRAAIITRKRKYKTREREKESRSNETQKIWFMEWKDKIQRKVALLSNVCVGNNV